jgi:divalent metal cation (Fe/Co/Zn/Cd) transporter
MQLGEARPLTVPVPATGPAPAERARLERRTRLLAWAGIGWHIVEFAIALAAGVAAGSIALIGFGADSLIEALAGGVVLSGSSPASGVAPAPPSGAHNS